MKKISSFVVLVSLFTIALIGPGLGQKSSTKRFLPVVKSRAEFDSMARIYHQGTPYVLPHIMFVIDRQNKNKIYYVNSRAFRFHQDFVNAMYLSLDRGEDFFKKNYINDKRRFILGTIAWQTPVKRWTFECWEGDKISPALIKLAYDAINKTFFEPVSYKPNSTKQDEDSAQLGIERILQSDINKEQEYQALNVARGVGRVHIIEKLDEHIEIGFNEILVLNEVPIHLPPVAGIIVTKPSTPLSHINLLAKGWNIPNAYIKNASELLKQYNERWISFETKLDRYEIKPATKDDLDKHAEIVIKEMKRMEARSDLSVKKLADLADLSKADIIAYGGKTANLGEVINAKIPIFEVPKGFAIPFYYYGQFIKENQLEEKIDEMLDDQKFVHDPAYRRARLKELRDTIQNGKINDELRAEVLKKLNDEYKDKGVFVRSSSNSEDLPNFSGAGLYTSVPNVKEPEKIVETIKTVWASLWNYEAYEARERKLVKHTDIYMGVLIQEGVNSESSGVIITSDPFNNKNNQSVYIAAKRGLGTRVVEGQRIAEQILYNPKTKTVRILTRSEEDSLVTFDESGGVREIPITGNRAVLTDTVARRLAAAALQIERLFGGKTQDIEWAVVKGQIYIVQSRPFVLKS